MTDEFEVVALLECDDGRFRQGAEVPSGTVACEKILSDEVALKRSNIVAP
jgi:hypothetical protein